MKNNNQVYIGKFSKYSIYLYVVGCAVMLIFVPADILEHAWAKYFVSIISKIIPMIQIVGAKSKIESASFLYSVMHCMAISSSLIVLIELLFFKMSEFRKSYICLKDKRRVAIGAALIPVIFYFYFGDNFGVAGTRISSAMLNSKVGIITLGAGMCLGWIVAAYYLLVAVVYISLLLPKKSDANY